jgi:threonyl-tRNA synthetase
MIILGKKEAEAGKISVRSRANKALESIDTTEAFVKELRENIKGKILPDLK